MVFGAKAKTEENPLDLQILRDELVRLRANEVTDYDPLLEAIGDSRIVLLGEASHGTHEFYRERALITKRLIEEKGFDAVAAEADFPDAMRVDRYVRGYGNDPDASAALSGFKRFPAWMWRNADVLDFVGWLRSHNDRIQDPERQAGFYGLDLYSLHSSINAVLEYLDKVDPEGAARARERYSCFSRFGEDTQAYGYATGFGLAESCENEAVSQVVEINVRRAELAMRDGRVARDDLFFAEQNAMLVRNAEQYYRMMYRNDVSSWNLRDRHMFESLQALDRHLSNDSRKSRIVVWEHNSHLGDARATDMGRRGEWNVGQLVRQKYGNEVFSVGFTTHSGTVTAATDWGGQAQRKRVRPAIPGSFESLFNELGEDRFMILIRGRERARRVLLTPRFERAIGVIYRPETEFRSHYFRANLADQFDAVIHFDMTRAVEPLEPDSEWDVYEEFESFPSGL